MRCPICNELRLGRIGLRTYFCKNCSYEILDRGKDLIIFIIDKEGNKKKFLQIVAHKMV